MFWDLYQQSQIARNASAANRAAGKVERVGQRIEAVEAKLDGLALACQAMWELLRENTNLTEDDISAKMEEIDLRDGRKDGKISSSTDQCSNCGRKTARQRATCLYCGHNTGKGEVFG